MNCSDRVQRIFADSIALLTSSSGSLGPVIARAASSMVATLKGGGKILLCGNGGSASDAQHFAAELLNRFERERRPLAAVALSCDAATLTAVGNDYDFSPIFAKQVAALGRSPDLVVLISTSGNSANILAAADAAHEAGLAIVALSGRDGGALAGRLASGDLEIRVPGSSTARIQEVHAVIIHCLCDLIDHTLFPEAP
jgi:phosphoheptose isomerase